MIARQHIFTFTLATLFSVLSIYGQHTIAITIDDVPNTRKFEIDNYNPTLLHTLDSLDIPIAIFINERKITATASKDRNLDLLEKWVQRSYITLGNHSYSHSRYSEVGLDSFKTDILKGEVITRRLAQNNKKSLDYFRFPYNDLGKDSLQQTQIHNFLSSKNYKSTPFTVESSDWMFNAVYTHYLKEGNIEKATAIGNLYVAKTLEYVQFFQGLSTEIYGRNISQIYLCHDNDLNEKYLPKIIDLLKKEQYSFISLDDAITDPAYQQKDSYYKKWGVSWLYRWMDSQKERVLWMKKEPDMKEIETLFEEISKKK